MERNHLSGTSASPRQGTRRAVQFPALEIFKTLQGLEQPDLIFEASPALSRRLDYRPPDVPSKLNFSMNLQHKIQFYKILSIPFISHKGA